jgi:hypothetical protein
MKKTRNNLKKIMEPPDQSQLQKVDNKQSPLTVADSAGKGKTSEAPPPPLKA